MDDLISRQAAIDEFKPYADYESNRTHAEWVRRITLVLEELPSAQQWIPCSERLPKEGKEVLISSDSGIYIAELEILDGNVYWNETIEYRSVKKVSAWMPLPEPYKGNEDDGVN